MTALASANEWCELIPSIFPFLLFPAMLFQCQPLYIYWLLLPFNKPSSFLWNSHCRAMGSWCLCRTRTQVPSLALAQWVKGSCFASAGAKVATVPWIWPLAWKLHKPWVSQKKENEKMTVSDSSKMSVLWKTEKVQGIVLNVLACTFSKPLLG